MSEEKENEIVSEEPSNESIKKAKLIRFDLWLSRAKDSIAIMSFILLVATALAAFLSYKEDVRQNMVANEAHQENLKAQDRAAATQRVFDLSGAFATYNVFLSRINQLCEKGENMTAQERSSSGFELQFNVYMILKQVGKMYLLSKTSQANAIFGPEDIRSTTREIFQEDRKVSTLYSEYCSNPKLSELFVYAKQNEIIGILLNEIYFKDDFVLKPEDIKSFENQDFNIPDSIYFD